MEQTVVLKQTTHTSQADPDRKLFEFIRELVSIPILQGTLVEVKLKTSEPVRIVHKLGRKANGVIIVKSDRDFTYLTDFINKTEVRLTVGVVTGTALTGGSASFWVF